MRLWSLALRPSSGSPATVERRIPVEAEYRNVDGMPVHVLLHDVNGYLHDLEVDGEDSQPVKRSAGEAEGPELIVM